jgi:threonine dehydrogenase-like Zn-dependent dehydrogenase
MRAVVYSDTRSIQVVDVPDAELEEPSDVVIRVTSSAICGTDLHMYDGRTGATPGLVLGHEPLGTVEHTGAAVTMVNVGDKVVIPTHLYCGVCVNCARGLSAACLRVRPGGFGAAYGYPGMGSYRGAQAELLRVPFADAWATLFSKGLSVGLGRTHDRRYTVLLRDLIISGRARPGVVVTHHGGLDDAPALYSAFDRRADGVVKAVLRPQRS